MKRLKLVNNPYYNLSQYDDQIEISDTGTYRLKKQPHWPEKAASTKYKNNIYLNKFEGRSRIDFEREDDYNSAIELLDMIYMDYRKGPLSISVTNDLVDTVCKIFNKNYINYRCENRD